MATLLIIAELFVGITASMLTVGYISLAIMREKESRSVIPLGARAKVERARARAEISELETRREAADIQRLALEPTRQKVVAAIHNGESVDGLPALNGGTEDGETMRDIAFAEFAMKS
jgi:hypothetical protein